MKHYLLYFFYPNPGSATYSSTSMMMLLALSFVLIAVSFGIKYWRASLENPITRKLSRSWSMTSFWFGIVGLVLVVARVEQIQFLAMRFVWVLWALALIAYTLFQFRLFRARHYEVLPSVRFNDPRDRYIPQRKKH